MILVSRTNQGFEWTLAAKEQGCLMELDTYVALATRSKRTMTPAACPPESHTQVAGTGFAP